MYNRVSLWRSTTAATLYVLDSRAMYLQSVRSPGWVDKARGARYKLSDRSPADNEDVLSHGSTDESSYVQDSFCVNSDQHDDSGVVSTLERAVCRCPFCQHDKY